MVMNNTSAVEVNIHAVLAPLSSSAVAPDEIKHMPRITRLARMKGKQGNIDNSAQIE
jgi:hypothetical protein